MPSQIHGLADIAGEAVLVAGGGRAILLQIANPAVGRGVAEHSDFVERPLDRLTATLTYIYAAVYGTADQLAFVRRQVNRAHVPVHGGGDMPYDAYDPALQLWVAATLYDTAVTLHEGIFGPLDDETAERVYRDYAILGTTLQMRAGLWPSDRQAFRRYWADQHDTLRIDATTRRIAGQILHPSRLPFVLRPAMPTVRLVTAGLLDADLRHRYHLPWDARRQRRYDRFLRASSAIVPRLPGTIRYSLRDHYLRRLRHEMTHTPHPRQTHDNDNDNAGA